MHCYAKCGIAKVLCTDRPQVQYYAQIKCLKCYVFLSEHTSMYVLCSIYYENISYSLHYKPSFRQSPCYGFLNMYNTFIGSTILYCPLRWHIKMLHMSRSLCLYSLLQLSKFLSAMQDEGVLKINEAAKGVETITEIDFKHSK